MKLCWKLGQADWTLPSDAAALQQSWGYGAAVDAMGGQVLRCRGPNGALMQVVLRRFGPVTFGLLSRGPIFPQPVAPCQQIALLRSLRVGLPGRVRSLMVTQEDHALPGLVPMVTPVSVAEVPLGNPDHMRARLHQKWRNRLVRAEDSKLRVSFTRNPDCLMHLIEREAAQQRRKRYRSLPPKFLANWVHNDPKSFVILRAMLGSESVAEMLFLDHAPGVTYQIGWTGGAGRTLNAHHLLLWHAMRHFGELGRARLDLGIVDTVTAPGLARFKLRAGAQIRKLGATGFVRPSAMLGRGWRMARPQTDVRN